MEMSVREGGARVDNQGETSQCPVDGASLGIAEQRATRVFFLAEAGDNCGFQREAFAYAALVRQLSGIFYFTVSKSFTSTNKIQNLPAPHRLGSLKSPAAFLITTVRDFSPGYHRDPCIFASRRNRPRCVSAGGTGGETMRLARVSI